MLEMNTNVIVDKQLEQLPCAHNYYPLSLVPSNSIVKLDDMVGKEIKAMICRHL